MSCKLDTELIQDFLEGTLDPLEKIIVEEHLKACETCQREFEEMKLIFRELDELGLSDMDIPPEIACIQASVINQYMSASGNVSFGLKEFLSIQKQVFEKAGLFLRFIPGFKPGLKYIQKNIKKTPSLLYKAIGGAVTSGRKLMLMRARA